MRVVGARGWCEWLVRAVGASVEDEEDDHDEQRWLFAQALFAADKRKKRPLQLVRGQEAIAELMHGGFC